MKRAEPLLVALVLVLAAALRLVALHADPPAWLSWSAGLYSDEGIYSEDSRLWVLYGQHMQGNFHIAAIAPLQYHLLIWVFRHSATISLDTVREVAVTFSLATLLCFWATLRRAHGSRIAGIAIALLAFSAPFLLYNRMGLLEMPALFWLAAAYLALAYADPSQSASHTHKSGSKASFIWLFAAGVLAGIAISWKATFALSVASLLIAAILRHKRDSLATIAGIGAALLIDYFAFVRPNSSEVARADHYYLTHQYLPHSAANLWQNIERGCITGIGDGAFPYLLHFAPLLLVLAAAAILVPSLRDRRDAWLWLWLAIPLAAMLLMSYSPSRYFIQFWPALAALAACTLARMPQRRVAAVAFAAALCVDIILLGRSYQLRTYTIQRDARALERVLPNNAWIAGQFAPTICMDCSLRSLYVQPGLANDSPDTLKLLPITHVLATQTRSRSEDPWHGSYVQMIAAPGGLRALPVGLKFKVNVYANLNALP